MNQVVIETEGNAWVTRGMLAGVAARHDWASLGIHIPESRTRDAGVSLIIAVVGVVGAVLGALIRGLTDLSISRIRIELDDEGVKAVEIPRDVTDEELDRRIAAIARHRVKKIILSA